MRRSLITAILLLAVGATATTAPTAAADPLKLSISRTTDRGDTRIQAERNILAAVAILRRLGAKAVNRKTNTLRSNTRVQCVGDRPLGTGHFGSFACTLSYLRHRLRLRYVAEQGSAFRLSVVTAAKRNV